MSVKIKGSRVEGGTEIVTSCPKCGKEKAYISTRKLVGICFYCGQTFTRNMVDAMGLEADHTTFRAVMDNYNEPLELIHPKDDTDARVYLAGRGVKAKDHTSDIRYCPKLRRLFFRIDSPDFGHYAPAWHTRSIDAGKGWICQPGVQKQHYWYGRRGRDRLYLVEGIFDAISLHNRGCFAIALLGTKMSQTHLKGILTWPGLRQVVVWLDDDNAGVNARDKIANQLEPLVETVVVIDGYPEPSESDEMPEVPECV